MCGHQFASSIRDINDVYASGQIAVPLLHRVSSMLRDEVESQLC
jgi:hypothetical protein